MQKKRWTWMVLAGVAAPAAFAGLGLPRTSAAAGESLKTAANVPMWGSDGRSHTLSEFLTGKALAVVFLGTECPLANSYAAPLSELADRYRGQGVQFVGVNANPAEDAAAVAKHAREYRLTFPVLKDDQQAVAVALAARVTPEAFVLDSEGRVRYRGRIDDAYATRTTRRPRVDSHDLETALAAVVDGRRVPTAATRALGCAIEIRALDSARREMTYYRDVVPILQERCQQCHRPGQVAPFSLTTFAEARKWAADIKTFTQARIMPPWKPVPGHGDFENDRRLSDAEIATLARWIDSGMAEGSPTDAPPAKKWPDGWMLGKPDLVVSMPEEFTLPASGPDIYRCFVLPTGLTEDRQVVGIEVRPGNNRVVHHVLDFIDTQGRARKLDEGDPGPGYTSFGGVGFLPDGGLGGWVPGNFPTFLPDGVGSLLPKGSDMVIQVHYNMSGKPEKDRTSVGLYFARKPVQKQIRAGIAVNPFLSIPPGQSRHKVTAMWTVPADILALDVTPHMHLLGREMRVWATLPDGKEIPLVWIKDWDFKWQDTYHYKSPIRLPAGTKVNLEAFYDNSAGNPRNPNKPPKLVAWGEETSDEMCIAFVGYILVNEADAAKIPKGLFGG